MKPGIILSSNMNKILTSALTIQLESGGFLLVQESKEAG
jgi:hypothetical protein